jgi:hypothetical protein
MKTFKNTLIGIIIVLSVGLVAGCAQEPKNQPEHKQSAATLEGETEVLASVNGSPVTKYELEQTILKIIGKQNASKLDKEAGKKILESLVASRAISLAVELELSEKDKAAIDKKAHAFREELLVKEYLYRHSRPQPVTQEMAREYYDANPERFGGRTVRIYEMISSRPDLNAGERDLLMDALKKPEEQKDWKKWVKKLRDQGRPVFYTEGREHIKMLHPKLRQLISSLKKGETSSLSFIEKSVYLVRIVDERKVPPKPLSEVSAQIQKSLKPVQLKKAIKQASEQVLKNAEVVYN